MNDTAQVFLSYHSADREAVKEIALKLRSEKVNVWFDEWNLAGGDQFQTKIAAALKECPVVAVFVGPGTTGPWQTAEVQAAINRQIAGGDTVVKRVIPVLLPGGKLDSLPAFLELNTAIQFPSTDDAEPLRRLIRAIEGRSPGPSPDDTPVESESPYRGLEPFLFEHARYFAGREKLVGEILETIEGYLVNGSPALFGILGDSGSGKSSLAQAGVVPALMNGIRGAPEWRHMAFKPGSSPLHNLALALMDLAGAAADPLRAGELKRRLAENKAEFADTAATVLAGHPHCRLAVVADQFEETFSICPDVNERQQFIDALMHAATIADSRVLLIVTLRTDFYGACAPYKDFGGALNRQHILLGPMDAAELEQAIEQPAILAGSEMEPGLAGMLLRDAQDQPGYLPLLQFALEELWRKRTGRHMTVKAYKEMNGLSGALNNRADELYNLFTPDQQSVLRTIMLRLVQITEDGRLLRTRVPMSDLCSSPGHPERSQLAQRVIDRLSSQGSRLITITTALAGSENRSYVEVAHEALIRNWKRLGTWLDEGNTRQFVLWRQRFQAWMATWRESNEDPEACLRGAMLEQALRWRRDRPDDFSEPEAKFIDASAAAHTADITGTRRRRVLQWVQAIAIGLAIAALAFFILRKPAADARLEKAGSLLVSNARLSMVIALRANMTHATTASSALLQQAFQAATSPAIEHGDDEITGLAFSSNGGKIATGSKDGTAALSDSNGSRLLQPCATGSPVLAVAALGANLYAVSERGLVSIRSSGDCAKSTVLELGRPLAAAAFNANGDIAGASADGQVCIWRSGSREPEHCYGGIAGARAVAWSGGADPRVAVAGDAAECALVNVRSGVRTSIPLKENMITSAAFDAAGRRLATAAGVGPVRLWDAITAAADGGPILPNGQNVLAATLSADGRSLVTANVDGSVAVWSTERHMIEKLIGGPKSSTPAADAKPAQRKPEDAVRIAIDPNKKRVAVAAANGKVRLYELDDGELNRAACKYEWDLRSTPDKKYLAECANYLSAKECEQDCRTALHIR